MKPIASRREFLFAASAAASASIIGHSLFQPTPVLAAGYVRRDIAGLSLSDPVIMSYRNAVKAMQALPASNPLSWAYQAAIHGTTLPGPAQPSWSSCQHGNYYFWPWHRMYLYWFEKIIRKMSGDNTWALPFWNWSSPSERQLPAVFRDTSSDLFTSHRDPNMNSGAGSLPGSDVSYATPFSYSTFAAASSSLEGVPHGQVHVDVGGWMGSVPTAGQDPIFYLHHCNIDRLWNLWLAQGGGRSDPMTDATWKNKTFTFFDENGSPVKMSACDVLRASEQLQYTYEAEPTQVKQYCLKIIKLPPWVLKVIILIHFPLPPIELGPDTRRVILDISSVREKIAGIARNPAQRLVLQLGGVEAERQPGASWEVYLGEGGALTTESPNYLGNVVLFGMGIRNEAPMGFKPAEFSFPVSPRTLALLAKSDKVPLVFVPHGILINGKPSRPEIKAPLKIGGVSLAIETETKLRV